MTRKQKQKAPRGLQPGEAYQETHGETGPAYVYRASHCQVRCGYPRLISVKALKEEFLRVGDGKLEMSRQGKAKLFWFEGPTGQVKAVADAAAEWRSSHVKGGKR